MNGNSVTLYHVVEPGGGGGSFGTDRTAAMDWAWATGGKAVARTYRFESVEVVADYTGRAEDITVREARDTIRPALAADLRGKVL